MWNVSARRHAQFRIFGLLLPWPYLHAVLRHTYSIWGHTLDERYEHNMFRLGRIAQAGYEIKM